MPGQQSNGLETSAQGSITAQAAVRIRGRQQVGGTVSNDVSDDSRDDPPAIRTRRLAAPRLTRGILSFGCLSSGTPRRPDRSASLWRTGRLRHECRSGRAGGALGLTPMPNLCPSRCAIVGNYDIEGLRPPQSRSLGSPPIAAPTIAFLLEPCRAARVLWRRSTRQAAPALTSGLPRQGQWRLAVASTRSDRLTPGGRESIDGPLIHVEHGRQERDPDHARLDPRERAANRNC